jgi:hypothetical protein
MTRWLLCVSNQGKDSLSVLKLYEQLSDPPFERNGMLRVVDDDGRECVVSGKLFVRALGGPGRESDDAHAELSRLAVARLTGKDPPGSWAGAVRAARAAGLLPAKFNAHTPPVLVLAFLGEPSREG